MCTFFYAYKYLNLNKKYLLNEEVTISFFLFNPNSFKLNDFLLKQKLYLQIYIYIDINYWVFSVSYTMPNELNQTQVSQKGKQTLLLKCVKCRYL